MILNGATVYNENVQFSRDCEEKIQEIVDVIKKFSPSSDISFRLVKNGRMIEGLMWGKVKDFSIGAYKRGPSVLKVLDLLYKRVQHECLKIMKKQLAGNARQKIDQFPMDMAG